MRTLTLELIQHASVVFPATHSADLLAPSLNDLYLDFYGGYFFGGALLIRSPGPMEGGPMCLKEWNADGLWKSRYGDACADVTFLAEDAFGVQFGIRLGRIVQFDPETSDFVDLCGDIATWFALVLGDPDLLTGRSVLHSWISENGPLSRGHRLIPKVLLVLGGDCSVSNLVSKDDVTAMIIRADICAQIRDVPDGQQIVFREGE